MEARITDHVWEFSELLAWYYRFLGISGVCTVARFCCRLGCLHSQGLLPHAPQRPASRRFL